MHRLVGEGEAIEFQFESDKGTAAQHVLCAVYAAGAVAPPLRSTVMDTVRKGFRWRGDVGVRLVGHLSGQGGATSLGALADPVSWALQLLAIVQLHDLSRQHQLPIHEH